MKLIKYWLILLIAVPVSSISQIKLSYYWEQRSDEGSLNSINYHTLTFNGKSSLFSKADSGQKSNQDLIQISSNQFKGFYFDVEEGYYYYVGFVVGKPFPVIDKDAATANNWQLLNEDGPDILGYSTKKAQLRFRGRNYYAFFAPDLPFNTGPFKFSGLPGTILEVFTDDNTHRFKALSVHLENNKFEIDNPYKNIKRERFISFHEYKDLLDKKNKEIIAKMQVEEDEDFEYSFKDTSIELSKF
jgi:GLPGLI family protein